MQTDQNRASGESSTQSMEEAPTNRRIEEQPGQAGARRSRGAIEPNESSDVPHEHRLRDSPWHRAGRDKNKPAEETSGASSAGEQETEARSPPRKKDKAQRNKLKLPPDAAGNPTPSEARARARDAAKHKNKPAEETSAEDSMPPSPSDAEVAQLQQEQEWLNRAGSQFNAPKLPPKTQPTSSPSNLTEMCEEFLSTKPGPMPGINEDARACAQQLYESMQTEGTGTQNANNAANTAAGPSVSEVRSAPPAAPPEGARAMPLPASEDQIVVAAFADYTGPGFQNYISRDSVTSELETELSLMQIPVPNDELIVTSDKQYGDKTTEIWIARMTMKAKEHFELEGVLAVKNQKGQVVILRCLPSDDQGYIFDEQERPSDKAARRLDEEEEDRVFAAKAAAEDRAREQHERRQEAMKKTAQRTVLITYDYNSTSVREGHTRC